MTVQCRYCETEIVLNEDSPETRKAGTDPHQQLRKHIEARHVDKIIEHSRRAGWLLDQIFFTCPTEPERWKENMVKTLDWLMEQK